MLLTIWVTAKARNQIGWILKTLITQENLQGVSEHQVSRCYKCLNPIWFPPEMKCDIRIQNVYKIRNGAHIKLILLVTNSNVSADSTESGVNQKFRVLSLYVNIPVTQRTHITRICNSLKQGNMHLHL